MEKTPVKLTAGQIHEINYQSVKSNIDNELAMYFQTDIFNYYLEEVGIETVYDYIESQDRINYYNDTAGYDVPKDTDYYAYPENDDDSKQQKSFDKIMSKKKTVFNIPLIKDKLQRHFLKELIENIPLDKILKSRDEVFSFVKMFEQKFLYEILIPVSKRKFKN